VLTFVAGDRKEARFPVPNRTGDAIRLPSLPVVIGVRADGQKMLLAVKSMGG
jgi:hypothetical protein